MAQKLENLPDNISEVNDEQIITLTEEFIGWGLPENLMSMAKQTGRNLFAELPPDDRVCRINALVAKNDCISSIY